jgi:hypothetical protein
MTISLSMRTYSCKEQFFRTCQTKTGGVSLSARVKKTAVPGTRATSPSVVSRRCYLPLLAPDSLNHGAISFGKRGAAFTNTWHVQAVTLASRAFRSVARRLTPLFPVRFRLIESPARRGHADRGQDGEAAGSVAQGLNHTSGLGEIGNDWLSAIAEPIIIYHRQRLCPGVGGRETVSAPACNG